VRAVNTTDLAHHVEKILQRIANGKVRTTPDLLIAATSGDADRLADTLWGLIRGGKGGLVGHERAVVSMLAAGTFESQDFLALLRQLNGANLFWYELWTDRVEGLAYHGWSKELEVLLDKLLGMTSDRTLLEWADVAEPAGSALLFALGRRGIVEAEAMPPDALHRFGRAFLSRGSWCPEQFAGWDKLWNRELFARAAFVCVTDVKEVGVYPDTLAPLVEYATLAQLAGLVDKLVWPDAQAIDWLAARGKAIVPHLESRLEIQLQDAKAGHWMSENKGRHIGALARIRAQNKESWPVKWMPLAKAMLVQDTAGLRDVLSTIEAKNREDLLLDHLAKSKDWRENLWALAAFPTQKLVDAVVVLLRKTPKTEDWDFEREPLFKTLGKMGEEGQAALIAMLDEPDQTTGVLGNLTSTQEHATKTIPYLTSADAIRASFAAKCWVGLEDEDRIELLDRHFDALSPAFVADLLGHTQWHLRAAELANRLPDTKETHHWRTLCMSPPNVLRPVMQTMAKTPREAIEKARAALAPEFTTRHDYRYNLKDALAAFGPEDLPAILRVTACHLEHRRITMWQLCTHFWPACPEVTWIAAFWWGIDSGTTLAGAAEVFGEAFLPALHARAESGTIPDGEWYNVLQIFTKWDPVGGFEFFTRFAAQGHMRLYVQQGVVAALEKGSARAREWIAQALVGKERETALHILSEYAVPEVVPILQSLEKQKLPAKHKKLLQTALAAQKTRGSTIVGSTRKLSARILHKVDGSIEALRASQDGQTLIAHAAGAVTIWNGAREAKIGDLGNVFVELSLDGRFVLVMGDGEVRVFDPWKNVHASSVTLTTDDGLGLVVPMPGGRAFTLCAAHNAYTPLTLWDLETGKGKVHRLNGFPAHVALIDDKRYVVGTIDEKMAIRLIDGGKATGKLQSWADYDGGGICMVASGHGGKLVAALFFDGTLMIWDISGTKIKALGRHARIAPRGLVMDPGSSWVVTPGTNDVLTWKDGQQARALVGSGAPAVRRAEPFEDVGLAVFMAPNVVAVGGQTVDVWDLETSLHIGRWDKPVTTMISALGKLFVGDVDGNIWEVEVV
jgi:hypothetical protein